MVTTADRDAISAGFRWLASQMDQLKRFPGSAAYYSLLLGISITVPRDLLDSSSKVLRPLGPASEGKKTAAGEIKTGFRRLRLRVLLRKLVELLDFVQKINLHILALD